MVLTLLFIVADWRSMSHVMTKTHFKHAAKGQVVNLQESGYLIFNRNLETNLLKSSTWILKLSLGFWFPLWGFKSSDE